jgi:hypothetical protein
MHDALFEAYGRTTFAAETRRGRLLLHVGRHSAELDDLLAAHGVATWAYVTAFNPGSRLLPAEANAARLRDLERVVAARGFVSYPGQGIGDDGRWPAELSRLVLGIGRADAMQLGQEFGQLTIVYGELGRAAELVACERGGAR